MKSVITCVLSFIPIELIWQEDEEHTSIRQTASKRRGTRK